MEFPLSERELRLLVLLNKQILQAPCSKDIRICLVSTSILFIVLTPCSGPWSVFTGQELCWLHQCSLWNHLADERLSFPPESHAAPRECRALPTVLSTGRVGSSLGTASALAGQGKPTDVGSDTDVAQESGSPGVRIC